VVGRSLITTSDQDIVTMRNCGEVSIRPFEKWAKVRMVQSPARSDEEYCVSPEKGFKSILDSLVLCDLVIVNDIKDGTGRISVHHIIIYLGLRRRPTTDILRKISFLVR
jgi:hypothetical protein